MEKSQSKLLLDLAKKLKKEKRSKEVALKSLQSAGLLTSSGKVSKHYPHLDRVLSASAK